MGAESSRSGQEAIRNRSRTRLFASYPAAERRAHPLTQVAHGERFSQERGCVRAAAASRGQGIAGEEHRGEGGEDLEARLLFADGLVVQVQNQQVRRAVLGASGYFADRSRQAAGADHMAAISLQIGADDPPQVLV
jgi:hypothetical protein